MKEKYELWKATLEEITSITRKEYCMMITICLLLGIILGIIFSPRKNIALGSYNGNHSLDDDDLEYEEEYDESCCDWD